MTDMEINQPKQEARAEGSPPPEDIGGKAYGLNILRDMGYPVPDFYLIPFHEDMTNPEVITGVENFLKKHEGIALRSSANIEDGELSSFAGQFESYLDVTVNEIANCIFDIRDSVNSEHVRQYCEAMGLPFDEIKMNVIVQQFREPIAGGVWMGNGELGGRLEWVDGRGDAVVNGTAEPHVEIYDATGLLISVGENTLLTDSAGKSVAEVCQDVQSKLGYDADIEFCITDRGIQLLQLRRVTSALGDQTETEVLPNEERVVSGEAASSGVATGSAFRLDLNGPAAWNPAAQNILIARATAPSDMLQIMTAAGVVTRMGGQLSHSAVVCRELGKPCVVGVDIEQISHDMVITIDGKVGKVFLQ